MGNVPIGLIEQLGLLQYPQLSNKGFPGMFLECWIITLTKNMAVLAFFGHLGASWTRLGASEAHLGASWGRLGSVLGASGRVLGASWSVLGALWE